MIKFRDMALKLGHVFFSMLFLKKILIGRDADNIDVTAAIWTTWQIQNSGGGSQKYEGNLSF